MRQNNKNEKREIKPVSMKNRKGQQRLSEELRIIMSDSGCIST